MQVYGNTFVYPFYIIFTSKISKENYIKKNIVIYIFGVGCNSSNLFLTKGKIKTTTKAS